MPPMDPCDPSRNAPTDEWERAAAGIELTLRPYQKAALAFMCREEAAQGGVARHFWVQVPCADKGERGG